MALFEETLTETVAHTDPMQSGFTPTLLDTTAFTDPSNLGYLRTATASVAFTDPTGFVDHVLVTQSVALQPFTNAKEPWTYVDSSNARYLSHNLLRVASNVAAASLTVQTFITNGAPYPPELHLIFVSSKYYPTMPTGWVRRFDSVAPGVASGTNGALYFTVWELDQNYKSLYPFGTSITVSQGFAAPLCVVYTRWNSYFDAYPVFISAHESHLSNQTTDQATPPLVANSYEVEARIIAMTADPHPTSGTTQVPSIDPSGYFAAAPNVTYPTSDSNNIVVAYHGHVWKSKNATGTLAMSAAPAYTSGVAVMSAVLRYRMLGPLVIELPRASDNNINPDTFYRKAITESLNYTATVRPNWGLTLTDPTVFGGTATSAWFKSATATAVASFLDATPTQALFKPVLTETPRFSPVVSGAWPRSISESLGVTSATVVSRVSRVLEALGLTSVLAPAFKYTKGVSETVSAADLLARFASGDIVDTVALSASLASDYKFYPALSEALGLTATANHKLVLRVTSSDTLDLQDAQVLKLLFKPVLSESIELALAYIAPGDSVTTWAVNTRNGAATEYMAYNFNSFAQVGRSYLGASSGGLYELVGNTDAGSDIISAFKSGYMSFGDKPVSFKGVYLGVRGGDDFFLKIDAADGRIYTYSVKAQDMETTRIRLGKGLRAKYFAFELISTGQDFDLDTIEFVPLVSQRNT